MLKNPNARFVLDHKLRKADCPSCGHKKTFRLYIDRYTGEHLPDHVGVCDRENNCSYSYSAAQWIRDGGVVRETEKLNIPPPPPRRTDWRCPEHFVAHTHQGTPNNLLMWLESTIGNTDVARQYRVGTFPKGKNYPEHEGAMVFWQIGEDGKERSGKIIQYNTDTGKRVKDLKALWMHTVVTKQSMEEIGCAQVYFGTHLLKDRPDAPVAIVESEKTAMICASLYPYHVWLATGGSNMVNVERSMCLTGRDVTVFPDQGMYEEWSKQFINIEPLTKSCVVSDILECIGAGEGEDIADYLVPINVIKKMEIDLFPKSEAMLTNDPMEVYVAKSPVDKMFSSPQMQNLAKELDLDLESATLKTLNDETDRTAQGL